MPSPLVDLFTAQARQTSRGAATLRTGTVTTVEAGGTVTVDLGGGVDLPGLHVLAGYTPTAGDRVAVLSASGLVLVLDRIT